MLRITRLSDGVPLLKVEGKLIGPWVASLRQACQEMVAAEEVLRLDLSAADFADGEGLQLLRELLAAGCRLVACSPLISEFLAQGNHS